MPERGLWTIQEIASELGMSSRFVLDSLTGRSPFSLEAFKLGRAWLIEDLKARDFIRRVREQDKGFFTLNEIAKQIGKSRRYVFDQVTGYEGKRPPSLRAEKQGSRWIVQKEEAERYIAFFEKSKQIVD